MPTFFERYQMRVESGKGTTKITIPSKTTFYICNWFPSTRHPWIHKRLILTWTNFFWPKLSHEKQLATIRFEPQRSAKSQLDCLNDSIWLDSSMIFRKRFGFRLIWLWFGLSLSLLVWNHGLNCLKSRLNV